MIARYIKEAAYGWLVVLSSWLVWIIAGMLIISYYQIPWQTALTDSLASGILAALNLYVLDSIFSNYRPKAGRWWLIPVDLVLITGIWLLADWLLLCQILLGESYTLFFADSLPVRAGIILLMNAALTVIGVISYRLKEQRDIQKREELLEKLSREAELYYLRQQLQPHFLFNSLNSINALVIAQPEEARKMIHQLSEFLRGVIRQPGDDQKCISLREELYNIQLYLGIEKVRFAHRLQVVTDIRKETDKCSLPPLLLQPLVENAVKFGLYGTTDDITISIAASVQNHYLQISVSNPYDPDSQPPKGTGFGLKAVQRRLFLMYGRHDLLEQHTNQNHFTVTLKIPPSS